MWSLTPPRPTTPCNYYVRLPDTLEYVTVRVMPEDNHAPGVEWFGPLPEPPAR